MGLFPLSVEIPKLTAWQATPIAFTGGLSVTHFECVEDDAREAAQEYADATGVDADFFYYLETQQNLKVLSRFEVGEWETVKLRDLDYGDHPEREGLLTQIAALSRAIDTIQTHVEPRDTGVEPARAIKELEIVASAVRLRLDELEDRLIAIDCDKCGKRIG